MTDALSQINRPSIPFPSIFDCFFRAHLLTVTPNHVPQGLLHPLVGSCGLACQFELVDRFMELNQPLVTLLGTAETIPKEDPGRK